MYAIKYMSFIGYTCYELHMLRFICNVYAVLYIRMAKSNVGNAQNLVKYGTNMDNVIFMSVGHLDFFSNHCSNTRNSRNVWYL